jgi:hypothetical protein
MIVWGGEKYPWALNDGGRYCARINSPPTADAGVDQEIECEQAGQGRVTLDGTASEDSDSSPGTNDDIVGFEWFEDYELPSERLVGNGELVEVSLALGSHDITLRVTDSQGEIDTDEIVVIVVDTDSPTLNCGVSRPVLWPPDHGLVDVGLSIDARDACDAESPTVQITITSDEDPLSGGKGAKGTHCPDAVLDADYAVDLRAERSGSGDGRVYVISIAATDSSGNVGVCSVPVTVPHSRKRDGVAVDSGQWFDATECRDTSHDHRR